MSADTPGVKTQLNFKTSQGTLVNVYLYSYDEDEIRKSLESIANVTPEINAVETLYNAQGTLKEALGATTIEHKNSPAPVGDGTNEMLTDKYGNEWTYNLPNAPELPDGRGRYVFKNWIDANGKRRKAWFDPAKGPKPFAKGTSEAPTIWPEKN
jgi:hypothetical protein